MTGLTILFNEHTMCLENADVANEEVDVLMKSAMPELKLTRVYNQFSEFERAVIHLEPDDLDSFINTARHSFAGLLVTTEVGVPFSRPHIVLDKPRRVVLAVRRMAALKDSAAWNAFLVASVDDCVATAEGRTLDVSEPARPMLRLFATRSEVVPALRVLCTVYEELLSKNPAPDAGWSDLASAAKSPAWWRRVLDSALVVGEDGKEHAWGHATPRKSSQLMERVRMEVDRLDMKSENAVVRLVDQIADGCKVTSAVVSDARAGLEEMVR